MNYIEQLLNDFEDDFGPSATVQESRPMFGDGGITEGKKANKGTFYLRIPNEDGVKISHSGTKFQMEQVLKKYKERLNVNKIPSNRLTKDQSKIVLEWGKNKSKALGETWSDKKTLKEYNNLKEAMRTKVKTKRVTGTGGSWSEGQIKPLTTEQKKLWDATMADEFGEWKDYPAKDRNRWRGDFPRKQKIYSQTKDLLNIDELAEYLGKEFNTDISRNKIRGSFGANNRTALGQYIRDNLFVDTFGSIKGKIEGEVKGNVSYYKKPTKTQIDKIKKQNLVFDTRTNTLRPKTLKNINILNEMYGDAYRSGTIPKLQDMVDATGLPEGEIAKAEARLAQIYNGHKFRNGPDDIRVNKNTASKLFNFMSKAQFGNPRKTELYSISLDLIDEGLGNKKNTFYNLKNKAKNILKENGIEVYSNKSPIGFNIDELAGVTGSAKSKNMAVSQFINVMEGNLNQTTLQNFQGQLSKSRQAVETAKGTPSYNSVLKKQMELINTRAANLETKHGVKLARLEKPADINNMTADEVKRLKNIKLGTNENLYQRLVKDAKASGYSVKMPRDTLTIQEFVDPKNQTKIKQDLLKLAGTVNPKCRKAAVDGGRIGLSEGLSSDFCINEGKKVARNLVEKNIKGSPAQNSIIKRLTGSLTNFVKSTLDPKELFDIKKQLFSKGAVLSLPIFDAGIAAYEAAAMGKPIKEAISNTLTFGSIPRAMGAGMDTPDVLNAKQLLKDPNLSPAGKEYAQLIIDSGNYEQMQSDTTGGMTKKFNEFKEIQDKIKNASTAGRFDYESRLNEVEGTEMAKDDYSPIFGSLGDRLKNRAINKRPNIKLVGPMTAKQNMKIDLTPLTYKNFKPDYGFTKEQFENAMRKEGSLADDQVYQDAFYKQEVEKPIEFQQLMELPSFRGASEKFAGGGIANVAGVDKGPPPQSGPTPQGLQGLFNRVKKI